MRFGYLIFAVIFLELFYKLTKKHDLYFINNYKQSNKQHTNANIHTYIHTNMSQYKSNKSSTPFCSFCRDAGKPRNVYTSHYPKDRPGRDGKVICPTILSTTCGYCRKTGHTTRYCNSLKQQRHNNRRPSYHNNTNNNDGWSNVKRSRQSRFTNEKHTPKLTFQTPSPSHYSSTKSNPFSALSDDEEQQEKEQTMKSVMDEFPAINGPTVVKSTPVLKGAWGKGITSAVKENKTFEKKPVIVEENEFSNMTALGTNLDEIVEQVKSFREEVFVPSGNWGDIVDSESDYESEYDSDSYSDYEY